MPSESADFMTVGLARYCEAFRAIQHFQRLVQKAAYDALNQRLDELSAALGVEVPRNWIVPYANPGRQGPDRWDSENWWGAWVAARIWVSQFSNCYAGIVWEPQEPDEVASAVVAFDVMGIRRAHLLQQITGLAPTCRFQSLDTGYGIGLSQKLKPEDMPNLTTILADIISEWARVFKRLGGVSGLNATMNQNGA